MLQANPEIQGNVIEQSLGKEVDNTEEAEVAIEMEETREEVDDGKEKDDVVKDQMPRSE